VAARTTTIATNVVRAGGHKKNTGLNTPPTGNPNSHHHNGDAANQNHIFVRLTFYLVADPACGGHCILEAFTI
jgi:hypothetical protein